MKETYKSRVYTDRLAYADFDAPHKFNAIQTSRRKKLLKALDWARRLPEGDREIVTEWTGSEAWYVYLWKIPAKWITGCRRMEAALRCA